MVLCHPPSCLHIFRQVSGKFFGFAKKVGKLVDLCGEINRFLVESWRGIEGLLAEIVWNFGILGRGKKTV